MKQLPRVLRHKRPPKTGTVISTPTSLPHGPCPGLVLSRLGPSEPPPYLLLQFQLRSPLPYLVTRPGPPSQALLTRTITGPPPLRRTDPLTHQGPGHRTTHPKPVKPSHITLLLSTAPYSTCGRNCSNPAPNTAGGKKAKPGWTTVCPICSFIP